MKRVELGSVASVKSGFAFKSKDWKDSGVPVIKIANVKDGFVTLDGCSFVDENVARDASAFELKPGDILISMTGYIGEVARVRNEGRMLLNQRVGKFSIKNSELLDSDFLFYCLRDPELKAKFVAHAYGAAQPNISPTLIEQQDISLPPLPIQRRIAGILSAYDELIENSQRRIKILEAMSRALYREWFVHFRFPGHESVPRVPSPLGGIPQGWEVKKLKEVCRLTMGQSPKSEFYNETGQGMAFHQGVTDFGDRFPTDRLFCTAEGRLAYEGDILFSVRAPVGRMNIANKPIILGRGLSAIRHDQGFQAFLWEQLRNRFTKDDMMGNGAIFASVTKDDVQGIELVCPPTAAVEDATRHFEPLHSELATLSQQIQNLRRTRDLLLPRLLSGQIDVEAMQS
jgi:type I restriction enzyme S subunit